VKSNSDLKDDVSYSDDDDDDDDDDDVDVGNLFFGNASDSEDDDDDAKVKKTVGIEKRKQESYIMRILKLASKEDQLELSRSMDKWTSIALWTMGLIMILTVISLTFEIIKALNNNVDHHETVLLTIIIQLQAFYILCASITLLLHIRTFRKVLLLDIRRGFETISDSILFKWMRKTGRSPFKVYADNFLPNVLTPFSSALQWVTWLSVFMVVLIIVSVMFQTLTPFKTVHDFGDYEATFFLSLAIVVFFVYKAYSHLQDSIENLTDVEDMNILSHEDGIEPLLILGDSLGFKYTTQLRKAVEFFEKHNGPLNEFLGDAKTVRSGAAAIQLAGSVLENSLQDEKLQQTLQKTLGNTTINRVKNEILATLDDKDKLAKRLQMLPGVKAGTASKVALFAESVGLVRVDESTRLEQLQQLYNGLQQVKSLAIQTRKGKGIIVEAAVAKAAPFLTGITKTGDREEMVKSMVRSIEVWVKLQGISDATAAMEFAQLIIPQFQAQDMNISQVADFLKQRLQVSDSMSDTILVGMKSLLPANLDELVSKFSNVEGVKQDVAVKLATFASSVGLPNINSSKELDLIRKTFQSFEEIKSSSASAETAFAKIGETLGLWLELTGVEDVTAINEFVTSILPKFQDKQVSAEIVATFLTTKLQTNTFLTNHIMSLLATLTHSHSDSSL